VYRRRLLAIASGVAAGIAGAAGAGAWCVLAGFVGVLAAALASSTRWVDAFSEENVREALLGGFIALIVWLAGSIAVKAIAGIAVLVALAVIIYIARSLILGAEQGA